jgi:hypothetical protein
MDVYLLVADGYSNPDVAEKLCVSAKTVENSLPMPPACRRSTRAPQMRRGRSPAYRVELTPAYRILRDQFAGQDSIAAINAKLRASQASLPPGRDRSL